MKGWLVSIKDRDSDWCICWLPVKVFKTEEFAEEFVRVRDYPGEYFVEEIELEGF